MPVPLYPRGQTPQTTLPDTTVQEVSGSHPPLLVAHEAPDDEASLLPASELPLSPPTDAPPSPQLDTAMRATVHPSALIQFDAGRRLIPTSIQGLDSRMNGLMRQ
jgi:hypothetical protein